MFAPPFIQHNGLLHSWPMGMLSERLRHIMYFARGLLGSFCPVGLTDWDIGSLILCPMYIWLWIIAVYLLSFIILIILVILLMIVY